MIPILPLTVGHPKRTHDPNPTPHYRSCSPRSTSRRISSVRSSVRLLDLISSGTSSVRRLDLLSISSGLKPRRVVTIANGEESRCSSPGFELQRDSASSQGCGGASFELQRDSASSQGCGMIGESTESTVGTGAEVVRVQIQRFRVNGSGSRAQGQGLRVKGSGSRV